MKRLFLTFLLFCFSAIAFSQLRIDWQQCYGSMRDDHAYSIMKNGNGYFVLGVVGIGGDGMVECEYEDEYHTWLIEIDNEGVLLNQSCKEFRPSNIFNVMGEDSTIFMVGNVKEGGSGIVRVAVLKMALDGEILWQHTYGDTIQSLWFGPHATPTPDGGLILCNSISFSGGDISHYYGFWDDWIVKLDSLGNIEWETTIGTEEGEYASSIIANPDGTYFALITGSPGENGSIPNCKKPYYNSDAVVVRLSADGNVLGSQCYGGSENEGFGSVINLENGCLFVGNTNSVDDDLEGSGWHSGYNHLGTPTSDAWLMKTDLDGNIVWSRCYGGSGDDYGSWVFQNDDGGFTVFGTTQSYDGDVQSGIDLHPYINMSFGQKIWIFRTDAEGNLLWERAIGSATNSRESIQDVIKLSEKEYAIAGTVYCGYPQSGDVNCSNGILFNGQDSWDNFWVLHITDIFNYDDPTGIEEQPKVVPLQMNVHPNPATTWVAIDYTLPNGNAKAELSIFNAMGVKVKQVELDGHQGQKVLDLRGLAPGVYFYTLCCGGLRQTDKLVLVR